MAGPLKDVTVLELAGIEPGPFAGMMLTDMGAEVIRADRIRARLAAVERATQSSSAAA